MTSVVGKLVESVVSNHIVDFLDSNKLILETQHGFRRKKSCVTNLLEFFNDMLLKYDKTKAIDIIYLDFKKAFDKVPHQRLLAKIYALGIRGKVCKWIEDWLCNRKQRVVLNGFSSKWQVVASGVPQGSVLGPILFITYLNDLDLNIISTLSKLADDTKLGNVANNIDCIAALRSDLLKLEKWSTKWQMEFNLDKCNVMHIGCKNIHATYHFLGSTLSCTNVEKDLGILISNDLKVTKQCIIAEKKAMKILGYIKWLFSYRDKNIIVPLYTSLVRPHLEYAVQFWSPDLRKDIKRLEKVQARATKLIPNIRNFSYEHRLDYLGMQSLEVRRLRFQLIQVYKIIHIIDKIDFDKFFTLSRNITRNNGYKLEAKRYHSSANERFFSNFVVNPWNSLSSKVVCSSSLASFKHNLDQELPRYFT